MKVLGRYNKELVIRLVKKKRLSPDTVYHIVLARRRAKASCRYDKLGFIETYKRKGKTYNVLGLYKTKIKRALLMGAKLQVSVYKLLFC